MHLPETAQHANRNDSSVQQKEKDENDKNGTKPNERANQRTVNEAPISVKLSALRSATEPNRHVSNEQRNERDEKSQHETKPHKTEIK